MIIVWCDVSGCDVPSSAFAILVVLSVQKMALAAQTVELYNSPTVYYRALYLLHIVRDRLFYL